MLVAVSCMLLMLSITAVSAPLPEISFYVGNGCYWEIQYDMVNYFELEMLGRSPSELTARSGYAGGKSRLSPLCYPNADAFNVYKDFGYSETVELKVGSAEELEQALVVFFATSFIDISVSGNRSLFSRKDVFDRGGDFRSVIGVPGGLQGEYGDTIKRANILNMSLEAGVGNEEDTIFENIVYVYDSDDLLFEQAEICMQFHDNNTDVYPPAYHRLKGELVSSGRLRPTGCPHNFVC